MLQGRSAASDQNNMSPPARKEPAIQPYFHTPKKILQSDIEEMSDHYSNEENMYTPKPHCSSFLQKITNQSTQLSQPSSPNMQWKTPQSILKTNPFVGFSGHSTPNTQKQHTPISPYSDRYIPFRQENLSRNLFQVHEKKPILPFDTDSNLSRNIYHSMEEEERVQKKQLYHSLLQETLLNIKSETDESVLQFKNKQQKVELHDKEKKQKKLPERRKIDCTPFKVLDAPRLMDDFYQDVLHWSRTNLIAVGLSQAVYLYNFTSGKVMPVAEQRISDFNYYTSLQWNASGTLLNIGTFDGMMLLWDAQRESIVSRNRLCTRRIATISWANNNVFACGTKEKSVLIGDVRVPNMIVQRWHNAHQQEVCGVAFADDESQIASGGNDNKVHVWSLKGGLHNGRTFDQSDYCRNYLQWSMKEHKAAIRALAWNPHSHGVLATGGGSADKTIKISSTLTNTIMHSIPVDSQVCKIMFSRNTNEIVSAHGYEKHQIMIWQYPQPKRICTLEGHTQRVLYMAFSPDDQVLVTGSGDETLKFWNIFPRPQALQSKAGLINITDFR